MIEYSAALAFAPFAVFEKSQFFLLCFLEHNRKNWLFCDSERGAHAASVLYSIVNTAKMNGLKVYEYLNWVFERIRNCDFNKMEDLVPWSEKIPEYVRIGGEKSDKLSVLESA